MLASDIDSLRGIRLDLRIPQKERRWLRRRNSVEPIIGHLTTDGKMRRCFLKGTLGDAINVLLCAYGQNLRKLLRWLSFALKTGAVSLETPLKAVLRGCIRLLEAENHRTLALQSGRGLAGSRWLMNL